VISGILAALVIMPVAIDLKFFVLLGMVAMTGAVLNAAMTALEATPELSPYLE
jgi:H+/Cl- antiporter ClcA